MRSLSLLVPALLAAVQLDYITQLHPGTSGHFVGRDEQGFIYSATNPGGNIVVSRLRPDARQVVWERRIEGSGRDWITAMRVAAGGIYLAGFAASQDFPITNGAIQRQRFSEWEPFLLKLDPSGALVYSTYYASGVWADAGGLAVGSTGELYVTGGTSPDRLAATPGALNLPGRYFTLKVNSAGSRIEFAAMGAGATHIALTNEGEIVVAGTGGVFLPVTEPVPVTAGSFQPEAVSAFCGSPFLPYPCPRQFVLKLNSNGSRVVWGTWITGSRGDSPAGLAIAPDGSILVAGTATTSDYPVTPDAMIGAYPSRTQFGFRTPRDSTGYVSRLSADGKRLLYSTFLGGSGSDSVTGFRLHDDGSISVTGNTTSNDFPASAARPAHCQPREFKTEDRTLSSFPPPGVRRQAWIARLTGMGTGIASAVVFGGKNTMATSIDADPEGRSYVGGYTLETDFPLSADVIHGAIGDAGVWLAGWTPSQANDNVSCITDPADLGLTAQAAPWRLLTLWGNDFGVAAQAFDADSGRAPTELAGLRVLFDGLPGRLLYVSPEQINVAVPFTAARSSSVIMRLEKDGNVIAAHRLGALARAPRAFVEIAPGEGFRNPVALNEDGSLNSRDSPAPPGSLLTLFLNGAGDPQLAIEDGVIARPPLLPLDVPIQVKIRDRALEVVSVTAAEGHVAGVWQVMVRIPTDVNRQFPLTVRLDGQLAHPEFEELLVWVSETR